MKDERNGIYCYLDILALAEGFLTDEELGRLVRGMYRYADGESPAFFGDEYYVFEIIKDSILDPNYHRKGANHPNWKGGVTPENQKVRNSKEMKAWKRAVFQRDGYSCQICGQIGGELQAHHIKPFAKFPELRFDVNNGITLCKECHKEVHRNAEQDH